MNSAHFHLLINHAPIFANLVGVILTAIGLVRGRADLQRAGLIAFVVAAVTMVPSFASGLRAAPVLSGIPGIDPEIIENHREAALWALGATLAVGIVSAIVARGGWVEAKKGTAASLMLGVLAAALAVRAGSLGGNIRHPEIGGDSPSLGMAGSPKDATRVEPRSL